MQLNFHHLRYFREVANEGNLGRAAARLNVSQSALSVQIKQLEQRLDCALFDRVGRGLVLTESGRIALDHADRIFATGDDLLSVLQTRRGDGAPLRIGALSTLSRNFQMRFLEPALAHSDARISLVSGDADTLFGQLAALSLDVVLTTELPETDATQPNRQGAFSSRLIDSQPIGLFGRPERLVHATLVDLLGKAALIVPTDRATRSGLAKMCAAHNVSANIVASVDDMAMVRLLTRQGLGIALAPAVVLADEIASGLIEQAPFDLALTEDFYAVTVERQFPHPLVEDMLAAYAH